MADEEEKPAKNKKINKMTPAEIDAALKKTEEHMKGMTSQYARALQARKAELQGS